MAEFLSEGGQDMIDEVNAYVEANPEVLAMNSVADITESNIYKK